MESKTFLTDYLKIAFGASKVYCQLWNAPSAMRISNTHNCPCPENRDKGFMDDKEFSDEELQESDEEN